MTITVKVSVNGNYKCPVSFKQGDREENHVISGRGMEGPNELYIPFYHGPDAMSLTVGPEVEDHGEAAPPEPTPGDDGALVDGGAPQRADGPAAA